MSNPHRSTEFAEKMRAAGVRAAAIRAFLRNYDELVRGETGLIAETQIRSIESLPELRQIANEVDRSLLAKSAIIKLNGGLGTSMGLDQPKSLLPIRGSLTFLDFIARQVQTLRRESGSSIAFLLMNSFNTSEATRKHLARYPDLGVPESFELMQSQVPKVEKQTLAPACWPPQPELEWCPPGHGDIYASLLDSGWLDRLLAGGVNYLFVSNSDNLGATLDLKLLTYFARSGFSFLMEVANRAEADRKGGHLALGLDGRFLLREAAQCPPEAQPAFQDIHKHRFFNTNNVWIRTDRLKELPEVHHGLIPLPMIRNEKPIDPRDETSPRVYQLETALGAAMECLPDAGAIVVPRSRFAPVKTTAELLGVRSDAYLATDDGRLDLASECDGRPPLIQLDARHYRTVEQLNANFAAVPSLCHCRELIVEGLVRFAEGIEFRGKVRISNSSATSQTLAPGVYEDRTIRL